MRGGHGLLNYRIKVEGCVSRKPSVLDFRAFFYNLICLILIVSFLICDVV